MNIRAMPAQSGKNDNSLPHLMDTSKLEPTVDSKKLEHGCRMMHAVFSSFRGLWLEDSHVPTSWLLLHVPQKSSLTILSAEALQARAPRMLICEVVSCGGVPLKASILYHACLYSILSSTLFCSNPLYVTILQQAILDHTRLC